QKGHIVETASSAMIFKAPAHPYTRKLMRATPRPGVSLRDLLPEGEPIVVHAPAAPKDANGHGTATPLLEVTKLIKEYPRKGLTKAFALFKKKPTPEPE